VPRIVPAPTVAVPVPVSVAVPVSVPVADGGGWVDVDPESSGTTPGSNVPSVKVCPLQATRSEKAKGSGRRCRE
jgi:hypothetical protein